MYIFSLLVHLLIADIFTDLTILTSSLEVKLKLTIAPINTIKAESIAISNLLT